MPTGVKGLLFAAIFSAATATSTLSAMAQTALTGFYVPLTGKRDERHLLFDHVIDSSEVGARKPEPAIYEMTRERLGVAHGEIFFIDDIGQNLKAARAFGWQTYLFRDESEALATLERLLSGARLRAGRTDGGPQP